ncbi:hypothetical protein BGW36DRAFT_364042 [Talaromyces proteolyticus]|uniref:CBM-cenC domain-containing protein n=1 Tax=Talaromyces proteolyticus TaxID=1131652 RepID=A0AAD4KF09_9EURO|nr:uncharacterized protein BGW36DRAFT_364042 [Talaromyces proteolyticus]KAH8690462.1 hypothetical protein BGW36DRAFT_364042 [Talaromyces proteolyticus]
MSQLSIASGVLLPLFALLNQISPGSATSVPVITCSTSSVQFFENPSFESALSDWEISNIYGGTSYSIVEAGTSSAKGSAAEDGSYYLQTTGYIHDFDLSQMISGLEIGNIYTVSYYSALYQTGFWSTRCWNYVYKDTTSSQINYFNYDLSSSWTAHTFTFQATATSHTLIFSIDCGSTDSAGKWSIGWDNFQVSGPSNVCTTTYSTISTPTPTPSHRPTSSSAAIPSSSAAIPSSSAVIPPSSAAIPSSSAVIPSSSAVIPPSSAAIPSSSAVIPSSSAAIPSSSAVIPPSSAAIPPSSAAIPSSSAVIPSSSAVVISSSRAIPVSSTAVPSSSVTVSSSPLTSAISSTTASGTGAGNSGGIGSSHSSSSVSTSTVSLTTTFPPHSGSSIGSSHTGISPSSSQGGSGAVGSTTSTIFTTRTATITACPSTVSNCPATAKTTYVTTETVVVSTTICPLTAIDSTTKPTTTTRSIFDTQPGDNSITETIYTTRVSTVYECAPSVTNCPYASKTGHVVTETLVVGTTVYPTGAVPTQDFISNTGFSSTTSSGFGSGSGRNPSATGSVSPSSTLLASSHQSASLTTSASPSTFTGGSVSDLSSLSGFLITICGLLAALQFLF